MTKEEFIDVYQTPVKKIYRSAQIEVSTNRLGWTYKVTRKVSNGSTAALLLFAFILFGLMGCFLASNISTENIGGNLIGFLFLLFALFCLIYSIVYLTSQKERSEDLALTIDELDSLVSKSS